MIVPLVVLAAAAIYAAWLPAKDAADAAKPAAAAAKPLTVPADAQRLARMIAAYEMLQYHFEAFETKAEIQPLIREMSDAISQSTDVGVTWSARHLKREVADGDPKPSEFEKFAMERLKGEKGDARAMWSDDHTGYVRAVPATHKNCTICHEGVRLDEDKLIGFTSIEFTEPLWR
jgi:hypothetical protein